MKGQHERTTLVVGGLAAILASAGCLGPLLLISLGVSGAWIGNLTKLEPYRPVPSASRWRPWRWGTDALSKALSRVPGVSQVVATFEKREARVTYDHAKSTVDALPRATRNAGYPSTVKP